MIEHAFVCQPEGGATYQNLFDRALNHGRIDRFDAAVAYATTSGVETLLAIMARHSANDWKKVKKRWLVAIDWCRSDPVALDLLANMDASKVRIFNGARVVARKNCTPVTPFHPKGFLLRGRDSTAVIVGSGNLSRNGLRGGHELGSVLVAGDPKTPLENDLLTSCRSVASWFENQWKKADDFDALRKAYVERYDSADNLRAPPPTEDDGVESDEPAADRPRHRGLAVEQLRQLRAARHFWLRFVPNQNRGKDLPGSQLMMSRMMRVFFGFPADDLPPDSPVGEVRIEFNGFSDWFSMRFVNNKMDVLNLPIPGREGPPTYDNRILLFRRRSSRQGADYLLTVGEPSDVREWLRRSNRVGGAYKMASGRPWGIF